jgi:hypothetical protein
MAGLDILKTGLNPASMILQGIGGVANVVGAIGQKNEAKKQLANQMAFGRTQRAALKEGYTDLISQAKGLPTFQGDITRYTQAQQEAERQKIMASGGGRVAGQSIAEERVRQATANTLAAAERGAQSGSDLLTAALMGQQQEGAQMQDISSQSMQIRQQAKLQAEQNYLQQMGMTAAAQAQQSGMQFQSEYTKAANILGLGQEQLNQSMNLEQNLFQLEQAKQAALQQARSAIWSGVGGIATGIGAGMLQMQAGENQMKALNIIYNPNNKNNNNADLNQFSYANSPTVQARIGGYEIGNSLLSPMTLPSVQLPTITRRQ